jgi:tRNA(Arg) A34 adenosine deaminase TadA
MDNESYIKECILLARKSEKKDEIPVGAILVKNNTFYQEHTICLLV